MPKYSSYTKAYSLGKVSSGENTPGNFAKSVLSRFAFYVSINGSVEIVPVSTNRWHLGIQ